MKALVLLAGCGLGDGSCIEETVLTYLALDRYRCSYQAVAVDMPLTSVNHISEEDTEERNVLVESARIGRGTIQPLDCVQTDDFDCLSALGNYLEALMTRKESAEIANTLYAPFYTAYRKDIPYESKDLSNCV